MNTPPPHQSVQYSPDGRMFWDGTKWCPAYLGNGMFWWDGQDWVQVRSKGYANRYLWMFWAALLILLFLPFGCAVVQVPA